MKEQPIRILIFGGSALGQNYLGLSNLFYKKFSNWVLEEYGLKSEINLIAFRSFDSLPEIIRNKLEEKKYDFIFIQIRPGLVNMRFNFLMRKKGKRHFNFIRNPYMRRDLQQELNNVGSKTINHSLNHLQKRLSLRDAILADTNAFLGLSFGYVERASKQINEILTTVFNEGEKGSTKIYVLGVFNSVRSPLVNFIYRKMNDAFSNNAMSINGFYVDVFKEMNIQTKKGKRVYIEDQYHLSKLGHEILANRLIEEFRKTTLIK